MPTEPPRWWRIAMSSAGRAPARDGRSGAGPEGEGLHGCDHADVGQVLDRASAGDVVDGTAQTLEDRPHRGGAGQALGDLVRDVAGVEVREHEDVGLAMQRAVWTFLRRHRRHEGGVELKLSVKP